MRQRVVLALALCAEPDLLIADEPTTALDVSIQAQIIALLKRLCRERGTAVMLITHDMGVIAETADRVAVMYAGRIAEIGPVRDVVQRPAPPLHQGPDGRDPDDRRQCEPAGADPRHHAAARAPSPRAAPSIRAARRRSTAAASSGPSRCRPDNSQGRLLARRRGRRRGPRMTAVTAMPLVEAKGLTRVFDVSKPWLNRVIEGERKAFLNAVTGVSFTIGRRETLALVGESGSGKSTVARMVVGLLRPTAGTVTIDGIDMWATARAAERQKLRRRLQMIFQDPYASLNPRWRVDRIIADPIKAFGLAKDSAEIEHRVGELLRSSASTRPTAPSTRTSSPAASASASASPAPCRRTPSSSSATSRPARSTFRCRRRSST